MPTPRPTSFRALVDRMNGAPPAAPLKPAPVRARACVDCGADIADCGGARRKRGRACVDCGADIAALHGNAKRCEACARPLNTPAAPSKPAPAPAAPAPPPMERDPYARTIGPRETEALAETKGHGPGGFDGWRWARLFHEMAVDKPDDPRVDEWLDKAALFAGAHAEALQRGPATVRLAMESAKVRCVDCNALLETPLALSSWHAARRRGKAARCRDCAAAARRAGESAAR